MNIRTPDLDEQLARLEGVLPSYLAKMIHFLRAPGLRWLRTAIGVLLIVCSFLWFLPIVGLEMFPIGLMLLAIDIPFLRGPVAHLIDWIERAVIRMMTVWEAVGARVRRQAAGFRWARKRPPRHGRIKAGEHPWGQRLRFHFHSPHPRRPTPPRR